MVLGGLGCRSESERYEQRFLGHLQPKLLFLWWGAETGGGALKLGRVQGPQSKPSDTRHFDVVGFGKLLLLLVLLVVLLVGWQAKPFGTATHCQLALQLAVGRSQSTDLGSWDLQ